MLEAAFYHNTTRIYTVAIGSIFNGIRIEREDLAGNVLGTIPVPLTYSEKEKFIRRANEISSIDDEVKVKETLPRMGFELLSMDFAPNRKTNTMHKISNTKGSTSKFMFNRVPYDFQFAVYIAARRIDDALRIVEQILPYFAPELNVRLKTMKDFPDIVDDIPIVLDSSRPDINAGGTFDDRRIALWELQLTLKGYLYCNVRDIDMIRKTIVELSDSDLNTFYEGYMSYLDPLHTGSDGDYEIIEEVITQPAEDGVMSASNGSTTEVDLD